MAVSSLIGALRVSLGINSAEFESGAQKARKQSKQLAKGIAADLSEVRKSASLVTTAIKGFLAVEVVQSVVGAAKAGLEYASSLGEVAQQLGVTTKELQEYRYAASQVGLSQSEIDDSLSKLTRSIGMAKDGSKEQVEAFRDLGVSIQDVNGRVYTAGELIPKLAGALSQIKDPAIRARIETELFGRAGQKLDTLLAGGSEQVNNLRKAARDLGIVLSEEQIQRADETADKLAEVKTVLEAKIAGVVADNAGAIVDLANSLGNLADASGSALSLYQRFRNYVDSVPGGRQAASIVQMATNPIGAIVDRLSELRKSDKPFVSPFNIWDLPSVPDGALPTVKASSSGKGKNGGGGGRAAKAGPSMADIVNESISNITLDDLENTKREANDAARRVYDSLGIDPGGDLSQLLYGTGSKQAKREEAVKANEEIAIDYRRRMQDQVQDLAYLYEDAFTGGTGSIWKDFERQGIRAISVVLAQLTVGNFGGGSGGLSGILGNIVGSIVGGGSTSGIVAGGLKTVASVDAVAKGIRFPGFATGGSFKVGGISGRDRNLVQFRASRGEMVNISKGDDQSGRATVNQTINFSGGVDLATREEVYRVADAARVAAMQGIRDQDRRRG